MHNRGCQRCAKADQLQESRPQPVDDNMQTWIVTHSGKRIDFLNPDPDQICIEDIAHALAMLPRFNGHTDRPYSIGQHSWWCSIHVDSANPNVKLDALMHDASEAYTGDITSPLKALLPEFRVIEKRLMSAIRTKFDLLPSKHPKTQEIDMIMRATEADYLGVDTTGWDIPTSMGIVLTPWPWGNVKSRFIERFNRLQLLIKQER